MNDELLRANLLVVFRDEARETLDALRGEFAKLRQAPGALDVAQAMRLAHNLKGAAAAVELEVAAGTAHALEDCMLLLDGAPPAVRDTLLSLCDEAVAALEAAAEGKGEDAASQIGERLRTHTATLHVVGALKFSTPDGADAAVAGPARASSPSGALEGAMSGAPPEAHQPGGTVRVAATRLDRLFGFVAELLDTGVMMAGRYEELAGARIAIEEAVRVAGASEHVAVRAALSALETQVDDQYRALSAFSRLSAGLTNAMRRARMLRLETLAAQLRRTVDGAAREVNKRVDLQLRLGDIELDRAVLEQLREPLVHLLRNAVDHGIEDADRRDLIGKPARGLVLVQAQVQGAMVELTIADDGAGIDLERLRRTLVRKGMIDEGAARSLGPEELTEFLFDEGFSTREKITRLSGRGVGLDVVRRAVAALGGTVQAIERGPMGGAAFHLRVPLSILATKLLLVRVGELVLGLPVHAVERVARVTHEQLRAVDGTSVVCIPGREPAPLTFLSHLLGGRHEGAVEAIDVVVVAVAGSVLALAVDEVLRDESLVVHRLPWNLLEVPGVSGAVALPDGQVIVVMDVNHLLAHRKPAAAAAHAPVAITRPRILVVDDSMTTRTLHRNVLVGAGYEVVMASDGEEAWRLLRDQAVDAIVSDVQMPGIDGFELARRVREHARFGSVPVVLVSSLAKPEDMQRGLAAGADEYVVKGPLEQDALLAAVRRHVG